MSVAEVECVPFSPIAFSFEVEEIKKVQSPRRRFGMERELNVEMGLMGCSRRLMSRVRRATRSSDGRFEVGSLNSDLPVNEAELLFSKDEAEIRVQSVRMSSR